VGLAAVMVALFLLSFGRLGRWVVLAALLFTSTISFNENALQVPLIPPLQQIRFAAEPITLILLSFLLLPSFLARRVKLRTPLLAAAGVFWILEEFHSLRWMTNVELQHGLLLCIIFAIILIVMGFGFPHWMRSMDDVHSGARCLGYVAILFVLSTAAQLAVNRGAIFNGRRLCAITDNPQHAAFMLAIMLVPVCLLLSSRREAKAMRVIWGATSGLVVVMLIWTGSRTGVLTALVGLGLLFRRRLGVFVGMSIVAAIFVILFLQFYDVELSPDSHIFSTQDTRGNVWKQQLEAFESSPFFGDLSERNHSQRENSYLTIACHLGSVGLALLALVIFFIAIVCLRLRQLRSVLPNEDDRILVDWIPAALIAIFVGAFFEAVLIGTLTFMLLSVYYYLGLLKFISDKNVIALVEQAKLSNIDEDGASYTEHDHRTFIQGPTPHGAGF
jgi:hypothetical protein